MEDVKVAGYEDALTGRQGVPNPPGAAQVPAVSAPELKSLLGIAVAAVVVAALYFGHDVLIPIVLAVMLSFVLSPVVDFLQRLRLWRAPAVILTVLAALGLIGAVGTLIGTQAAGLAQDAPRYAQTIQTKVAGIQTFSSRKLATITKSLAGHAEPQRTVGGGTIPTPGAAPGPQRRPVLVEMANNQTSPLAVARTVVAPILGPLETTLIVLIVAIFILLQKEDLRDRFIRLFGSSDLHRTTAAMDDAGKRLSRYFLSQLGVNTCFGVVIGLGLWLIGIPAPAMWGLLAGLLRFVPYVGSLLAAIAPMALAAAIDPGWSGVVEVGLLFLLVEPITGYVVEPLLYGHSTGLSPISVIVAAIFWTWLWGPIGLILSTPLTLCLVVVGRHVKSLEFFDVMLGDRPALTPTESFYQRVLANNPDEALAQAEALLAERPLVDYYDGVVLEGLKLAAEDEARGTIDAARAATMARTMTAVIADLGDHAEARQPVVAASGGGVACIAGRGPFDDAVTAMLAQLLGQHGMPVRSVPHAAVSREAIGTLDLAGVEVVAISYLQLAGSPAHLRYLIRRLRQRAPAARIVVGLWPEGEAAMSEVEIQRAIGADVYVGSLADAVAKIRDAAGAGRPDLA
jgi:predicted PurR-regulated permease PerM